RTPYTPTSVAVSMDAESAAHLPGRGNSRMTHLPTHVHSANHPSINNGPRRAAAPPPAFARQLQRNFPVFDSGGHIPQQEDDWAVLLLHGLKSPGGRERLVYVVALGNVELDSNRVPG